MKAGVGTRGRAATGPGRGTPRAQAGPGGANNGRGRVRGRGSNRAGRQDVRASTGSRQERGQGRGSAPSPGATAADPDRSVWWHRLRLRWHQARSTRHPGRAARAWLTLVAVLAAGVVFLFFWSSAFVVKDVQVSGGREEVQTSALDLAAIPEGRPMARVAEGPIGERVLTDPRIAAVTVERQWPDTVHLTLTERDPVLALSGDGQTWLADASGVVYEQVDKASNKLPSFSSKVAPTELDQGTVAGLGELWRLRPDPDVLEGKLTRPRVDADGMVTLRVEEVRLVWGAPVENEKKWQVVAAIIGQDSVDPQSGQELTIDVQLPDTPVVTGLPVTN